MVNGEPTLTLTAPIMASVCTLDDTCLVLGSSSGTGQGVTVGQVTRWPIPLHASHQSSLDILSPHHIIQWSAGPARLAGQPGLVRRVSVVQGASC